MLCFICLPKICSTVQQSVLARGIESDLDQVSIALIQF